MAVAWLKLFQGAPMDALMPVPPVSRANRNESNYFWFAD